MNWRDEAAAGLLASEIAGLGVAAMAPLPPAAATPRRALLLCDPTPRAARAFEREGWEVTRWHREKLRGCATSPWPPRGPYRVGALRLPRAKEELEMLAHAAAGSLAPGAPLFVFGANDEGIRSAPERIGAVFGEVRTVAVRRRCRVLRAARPRGIVGLKPRLADWKAGVMISLEGGRRPWVSYPGVFAHGRMDPGSRLLLGVLPEISEGERVLDLGCGSGVLGAAVQTRQPAASLDLVDIDAIALEAARENVPEATLILGEALDLPDDPRYDVVLCNPPHHSGKEESLDAVEEMIGTTGRRLHRGGWALFVTQRRLPVEPLLRRSFRSVAVSAQDPTYRVWSVMEPR